MPSVSSSLDSSAKSAISEGFYTFFHSFQKQKVLSTKTTSSLSRAESSPKIFPDLMTLLGGIVSKGRLKKTTSESLQHWGEFRRSRCELYVRLITLWNYCIANSIIEAMKAQILKKSHSTFHHSTQRLMQFQTRNEGKQVHHCHSKKIICSSRLKPPIDPFETDENGSSQPR